MINKPSDDLQILINLLGGAKFCAKFKCSYIIDNDRSMLTIAEIKGKHGCTHIRITINDNTYAMKFYRMKGWNFQTIYEESNITSEGFNILLNKYLKG